MFQDENNFSITDKFRRRIQRSLAEEEKTDAVDNNQKVTRLTKPVSESPVDQTAKKTIDYSRVFEAFSLFSQQVLKEGCDDHYSKQALLQLIQSLGMEAVFYYDAGINDDLYLRWHVGDLGDEDMEIPMPRSVNSPDGFIGSIWANKSSIFVGDLGGGSGAIRAFVGYPLFHGLDFRGALVMLSSDPHQFSNEYKTVIKNAVNVFESAAFESPGTGGNRKSENENRFAHCFNLRLFNDKIIQIFTDKEWIDYGGISVVTTSNTLQKLISYYQSRDFKEENGNYIDDFISNYKVEQQKESYVPPEAVEVHYTELDTEQPVGIITVPLKVSGREFAVLLVALNPEVYGEQETEEIASLSKEITSIFYNLITIKKLQTRLDRMENSQTELIRAERLRALGEMSTGVAHDFNNILAAIMGKTELLKETSKEHEIVDGLNFIEAAAMDGAQIIKRIQDFARYEPFNEPTRLNLNRILTETIRLTEHRWKSGSSENGRKIVLNMNLNEIPDIEGQAGELKEVFTNLILNSIDAMPDGGVIGISSSFTGNRVLVTFSDTGDGMTDDVKNKIFEPFFTTKGPKGSGLGLSVAYGIIQSHRGEINVDSKPDEGTTFSISFPALLDESSDSKKVETNGPKQRILVALKDKKESGRIKDLLFRSGYHAIGANPDDPAYFLQNLEFNAIITDNEVYSANNDTFQDRTMNGSHPLIVIGPADNEQVFNETIAGKEVFKYITQPYANYQILLTLESVLA
ncbi:MAG: hypothetical protein GF307_01865 [candidate division Zixibacteria bacterium]|nr:hypothetical protein [candidate division Zixibacteria bacterium]